MQEEGGKIEYRVWNPFRSKIAAAILGGIENIWIRPGTKVLYLGAASGTTVSHVSDVVGPVSSSIIYYYKPYRYHSAVCIGRTTHLILFLSLYNLYMYLPPCQSGLVYAVEFSHRSGRDLINVAKKRTNIIPIIEDARHPHKYRMLVGMVDVLFADVAQPDQARILAINASYFLKNGGKFVISIKVISSLVYRYIEMDNENYFRVSITTC